MVNIYNVCSAPRSNCLYLNVYCRSCLALQGLHPTGQNVLFHDLVSLPHGLPALSCSVSATDILHWRQPLSSARKFKGKAWELTTAMLLTSRRNLFNRENEVKGREWKKPWPPQAPYFSGLWDHAGTLTSHSLVDSFFFRLYTPRTAFSLI